MRTIHLILWLAVAMVCGVSGSARAAAVEEPVPNDKCFECHGMGDLSKTNAAGKVLSLFVDEAKFKASVHGTNNCVQCHLDLAMRWEHPEDNHRVEPVNCTACHTNEAAQYAGSIHGFNHQKGGIAAACSDCHGKHDMAPVKSLDSPVFKLNLPQTCARCHNDPKLTEQYRMRLPEAASQYLDSIHGKGLIKMGLIVAPSCNDCHGVHDIIPGTYTNSPVSKANISRTCGKCHVKIEATYNKSVHGQLHVKGDPRGPVCTDCHSAHAIERPGKSGHFKSLSDERCGKCHQDRLAFYRETYHGKAMALGQANAAPDVAACFDCHGHHDVLKAADPKSRLSPANIVGTCKTCHPKANVGFTQYKPHANPMDRVNYPVLHGVFVGMTGLLIGVFGFFGAHTGLWLFRSGWVFMHDSKKFREARVEVQQGDEWFTRFVPFERFLHLLVVTSFLLLVTTGMPLKFFDSQWARVLFDLMGGPQVARSLHHFGAIITFLYFGLHMAQLVGATWRNRDSMRDPKTGRFSLRRMIGGLFGPNSMIPTLQDFRDFVAHQKWFFGKGPKPQFDRWTYWEKFDYFAVFWGVFAIGVSGLIMWFPEWFTQFMPGWIINIALIVHSDEALLAAGFIFTIHFFNTHFRLEKFPMDTVIFSGRISKAEMLHERRRWYDRLVADKTLDDHRLKDEWLQWKGIARAFGYLFFGTGVVLLVLIVIAMTMRLL